MTFHRCLKRPILYFFFWAVLSAVLFVALMIGYAIFAPDSNLDDMNAPLPFSIMMLSIIVFLPGAFCRRRPGTVWSGDGRFRWDYARRALLVALPVTLLSFLPILRNGFSPAPNALLMLGLAVILVPLQSVTEEVIFRSLLPQVFGRWLRSPWLAYLPSIPLFVAGHTYNWIGLVDIFVFAVCLSVLTVITNGIEYGCVIHACNNFVFFTAGILGYVDVNAENVGWGQTLLSALTCIVISAILYYSTPSTAERITLVAGEGCASSAAKRSKATAASAAAWSPSTESSNLASGE